ncbi:MAG: GerMN domain-containing protein [Acidimicrobiales bacterium]
MRRLLRTLDVREGVCALMALVVGALVLGACGVPTQPSASPISTGRSHISLPPTRPTVSPCTRSGCVSVDVYFVTTDDYVVPADRVVPRDAELSSVVRSLLSGPTPAEQAKGIRTALGGGIRLLSASVTDGDKIATLNFNTHFFTLSGPQEVLAVAQVVFTVTSVAPDTGVTFQIDGGPIPVPVGTGALATTIVVHASEYASLRTPTRTLTTTPTTTTPVTTTPQTKRPETTTTTTP